MKSAFRELQILIEINKSIEHSSIKYGNKSVNLSKFMNTLNRQIFNRLRESDTFSLNGMDTTRTRIPKLLSEFRDRRLL